MRKSTDYWPGISCVREKIPRSKDFPVHTLRVNIGDLETVSWGEIRRAYVWFQLLGEPNWEQLQSNPEYLNEQIKKVLPAISGNERMYQSWVIGQWWWWANRMIWRNMTFDPYNSFHICSGYIWSAAGSSWPHEFMDSRDSSIRYVQYPDLTIWDMVKATKLWLMKLHRNQCINLDNWFSEISWISFWWQTAMALAAELADDWIDIDKLIPIEATTKPTAFICWTWHIYDKLCNLIPEHIAYKNAWAAEEIIDLTIYQLEKLLSRSSHEITEQYQKRPELIKSFFEWDSDFKRWDFLDKEWNEKYKYAVNHVIKKLVYLKENYKRILKNKNLGKKEIYDSLLWIARTIGHLVFSTSEYYQTRTKKQIREFLDKEYNDFRKRFNLEAMRLLIWARGSFVFRKKHIEKIRWIDTTFILNEKDVLYTPDSIRRSVREFNKVIREKNRIDWESNNLAQVREISSFYWHDAPFKHYQNMMPNPDNDNYDPDEVLLYQIMKDIRMAA